MKLSLRLASLLAPIFALFVAFGLSITILYLIGEDPFETFTLMYDYGKTGKSIARQKHKMIEILFLISILI